MKCVISHGKNGLVSGMEWRVLLRPGKRRAAEVRKMAREREANKVCLVGAGEHFSVGLGRLDDDVPKGVKRFFSLGALLASAFGKENVVCAWLMPRDLCAVIVVEDGLPVVDVVQQPDKARETVQGYIDGSRGPESAYRLIVNSAAAGMFPTGEPVSSNRLLEYAGPSNAVHSPPTNLVLVGSAALVLMLSGGGVWWYSDVEQRAALQRSVLDAAAKDPLPKYRTAVRREASKLGLDRGSLLMAYRRLESIPTWIEGWQLKQIKCGRDGRCTSTWIRKGGSTRALLSAWSGVTLHPDSKLDQVHLQWREDLDLGGVDSPELVASDLADPELLGTWQSWSNADVNFKVGDRGVGWPSVPGVSGASIPAKEQLKSYEVAVSVQGPLAVQMIQSAPAALWWQELTIEVSDQDPKNAIRTTLKAAMYAH